VHTCEIPTRTSQVRRQAISFHEGIADLCPSPDVLLAPFSLAELQTLLCGTRRVEWSEAELRAMLRPAAPLTKDSPVICHLVAELLHMGNEPQPPSSTQTHVKSRLT
jgi:hypothetical protein